MKPDWTPLRKALADCRRAGVALPFWWRDDDAVAPTAALERLHRLSSICSVPVHIAVIPGLAERTLAQVAGSSKQLVPIVHGWRHENHSPKGAKKAEFGTFCASRNIELEQAQQRMQDIFGPHYLRVFVPPWNRMDPAFDTSLAGGGYVGLSTFTARKASVTEHGLVQINCHIDPIDWHGDRGLIAPEILIAQTVHILNQRLHSCEDATEPLGYLTHHLVHTTDLWEFSGNFVRELMEGGAVSQPLQTILEPTNEQT